MTGIKKPQTKLRLFYEIRWCRAGLEKDHKSNKNKHLYTDYNIKCPHLCPQIIVYQKYVLLMCTAVLGDLKLLLFQTVD
jgi:hypothetical protein